MSGHVRRLAGIAVLLIVVVLAVGCGSSGSSSGSTTAGSSSAGGKRLKFIMVDDAPSSEPFVSVVLNGLQAAGKAFGVDVEFRATPDSNPSDPGEQKRLLENAIAAKPDGIITDDAYPNVFDPIIKQATDAGIPVVIMNKEAPDSVAKTGALTFVGMPDVLAGQKSAEMLTRAGAKHVLEVTVHGLLVADDRNKGFEQSYHGKVTQLALPLSGIGDTTAVRDAILAKLQQDHSIDAVWAVGSAFSAAQLAVVDRLGAAGKKLIMSEPDLNKDLLQGMVDGKFDLGVDQQQYLQGYLPVMYLQFFDRYKIKPATDYVNSGPAEVTPSEAPALIKSAADGVR